MEQDARYALILENLAEINARLRVLDEAYAHLEAAAERQLEILEILATHREPPPPSQHNQTPLHNTPGNGSHADARSPLAGAQPNRFIDRDMEYSRETHPALFKVVDLLEEDEQVRSLSVRQLAQQTGVGKSWCAVAKRYVQEKEAVQ